jgi:hypothetical protein
VAKACFVVLYCAGIHKAGPTVAAMNLRLVCVLARPFYQTNEFHFYYICAFRSAGYVRLTERAECRIRLRSTTENLYDDIHLIRSDQSNFVVVTHSFIVFRATVVQKLSNPGAFPEQDGCILRYSFCCLYIQIF